MRPFLVTEPQAGKLPRWGLLLLCALYVLPGFVGRDPWRQADASGFGIALTMARGLASDWLMPNIAGERIAEDGPFPFWIGAAAARIAPFLGEHVMVRAATMAMLALAFIALWYAVYALARRPGVLPADPFGATASRVDFGRAIADSALLVLMATIGLIAGVHETTGDVAQLMLSAIFLHGAATALERPGRGALTAGLAIGISVATRGLAPAGVLLATVLALPMASQQYRLVAHRWLPGTLLAAVCAGAAWPLALGISGPAGQGHLLAWLHANRSGLGIPTFDGLAYWARTLPWFFWPAWPMAIWALTRWRGRLTEPALALPVINLLAASVAALASASPDEASMMPAALPVAMLAAIGLPTLRRSVVSLIDWFAVMTYSVIGLVVWAYWIAFVTGFPPKMAYRASRIAPGFEPGWLSIDIVLGVLATAAWVLLVRWRISRHPPMIWRAVVLSCGGLVLAWFLLMTLWLPAFNQRNTYREVSQRVAAALEPGYDCVSARFLGRAQRATLFYFGGLRFGAHDQRCSWLLVQDEGPVARTPAGAEPGWKLRWEDGRLRDPDERLRLYRRAD